MACLTKWLEETSLSEVSHVGGKNASLGEMISNFSKLGIKVPDGFVITIEAYDSFMQYNDLYAQIRSILRDTSIDLKGSTHRIKGLIQNATYPVVLEEEITYMYDRLAIKCGSGHINELAVAVRSSADVEDSKGASFAGQHDSYLNVCGRTSLLERIKSCFASVFNERAIDYRKGLNIGLLNIKLSVCVQKMVRSDIGSAGVAFSIDPESGNKNVIVINSSYGLGEIVVGGQVAPDEFLVFKPTLRKGFNSIIDKKIGAKESMIMCSDSQDRRTRVVPVSKQARDRFSLSDCHILELAGIVCKLEDYYTALGGVWCPVDVEWAVDGETEQLFIVQARPETVHANRDANLLITYSIDPRISRKKLGQGVAVGDKIASGKVQVMRAPNMIPSGIEFESGNVLVAEITDPDWEPIMKQASAIVTEKGGRTCHAAIIAREIGIPAVVGMSNATNTLLDEQRITVSCGEGDVGYVYEGEVPFDKSITEIDKLPDLPVKMMLNVASPDRAFQFAKLPNAGVGLAREEFIINNFINVHPLALLNPELVVSTEMRSEITKLTSGYQSGSEFFVKKLAYGIARIGAAFHPKDVIVRFSDFKTNEYAHLLGGKYFEPHEENPMIGWRGASRYYSSEYEEAFGLECESIKLVRNAIGLTNVIVMIPFCRTVSECKRVLETMEKYGLKRGENGLQVYLMCEIPSNVLEADEFCQLIDGFSIGSNDLTQLTLGLDRDSELVQHIYDERNTSVKKLISLAIQTCKTHGKKIGICGQAPSDFPDFARFLIEEKIDSISLTPDSVIKTYVALGKGISS